MRAKLTPTSGVTLELHHVNGAHLQNSSVYIITSCKQGVKKKGSQPPLDR